MSSAVTISRPKDEVPLVTLDQWNEWCAEHAAERSDTSGGPTWYIGGHGGVEVKYGRAYAGDGTGQWLVPADAHRVTFSTFHCGAHVRDVADLALAFWQRFGGRLDADPEVAAWFTIAEPIT